MEIFTCIRYLSLLIALHVEHINGAASQPVGCVFNSTALQYEFFDPNWSLPSGGWIEQLPGQKTSYDKYGNVIQKVHILPSGCFFVIERCHVKNDSCIPEERFKWKFGGCNWTNGTCIPNNNRWKEGVWGKFPPQSNIDCHNYFNRRSNSDHNYGK